MSNKQNDQLTGMWEVFQALEAAIASADPAKREALAATLDAYSEDFPEDFDWAVGRQSPSLLYHLFTTIDVACRPGSTTRGRMLRKPEGNA